MTTHHEYHGYVFSITYEVRERAYKVNFFDFPDMIANGETISDAFARACEALDLLVHSMRQLRMPAPKPKYRLIMQTVLPLGWRSSLNRVWAN